MSTAAPGSRDAIVVVGASLAGLRLARELRSCGFEGSVTMVGEEPEEPYDRPPLSKAFLAGTIARDALTLAGRSDLDALGVDLLAGTRADSVDLVRRVVRCDTGVELRYDRLVAASGAHARRPVWARDLDGVHVLRTLQDSVRLRAAVEGVDEVVVVGGGYIGTEVASTLCAGGKSVTLVLDTPVALSSLGDPVADRFTRLLQDRGVRVLKRAAVVDIEGHDRVESLLMADGRRLLTSLVLVCVGASPTTGWIPQLTDDVTGRIRVKERGRAHRDVWAAGDVTGTGHWFAAARQARLAARSILDVNDRSTARLLDEVPYAWTDQFEHKVQTVGLISPTHDFVLPRGHNLGSLRFTGLYAAEGVVTGAVMVDRPQDLARARRFVMTPTSLDSGLDELGMATA